MLPTEYLTDPGSKAASDPIAEVSDRLRVRSDFAKADRSNTPVAVVAEQANNALQALMNLFYLIAREARLEPQLRPLVAQIQAELAQLSRWIRKLGPHADRPSMQKE